MLKQQLTKEEIEQINEISKLIFKGSTGAYMDLEKIKLICMNIKISVAKLGDNEEARALSKIGDIITESINKIESMTKEAKEASKLLGTIVKED